MVQLPPLKTLRKFLLVVQGTTRPCPSPHLLRPFWNTFMCTHTCHMLWICTFMGQERGRGKYCYLFNLGPPSQHVDSLTRFILSLSNFITGTNLSYANFSHVNFKLHIHVKTFCHSIWVFLNCGFKAKWLIGNTLLVIIGVWH
jgi:hypothetical protein